MNDTEKKLALRKKSRSQMIWRQFRKSRTAILGLCVLTVFVLFAVFADVIEDFDTRAIATNQQARFETPSLTCLRRMRIFLEPMSMDGMCLRVSFTAQGFRCPSASLQLPAPL